jgi:hypothetical protein
MGLQVTDLINKLRKATGQDEDDLSDDDATLQLNISYWEIIDKFPFREKEVRVTFPTVAGERAYNCPTPFEALRHLAILEEATNVESEQHTPLDQMGHDPYEQKYNEAADNEGKPTHYVRDGCMIILYPTPDDVYTITMRYWTTLDDLSDSQNPNIPQSWHEIIYLGALWREFLDIGDHQRMASTIKVQERLINAAVPVEAKEEVNNPRAGLEVLQNPYP